VIGGNAAEPEQVGGNRDQLDQHPCPHGATRPDDQRHGRQQDHAAVGAVIGQRAVGGGVKE
jgi:hypothetical protein